MKRIVRLSFASLVAVAALAYLADYLSVRLAIPKRELYDSVEVRRFFAVKLKNHSTSYMFQDPQPEECINSLFPHFGDNPCWYTKRHTTVEVDINSGPAGPLIDTP